MVIYTSSTPSPLIKLPSHPFFISTKYSYISKDTFAAPPHIYKSYSKGKEDRHRDLACYKACNRSNAQHLQADLSVLVEIYV
jgi:hypothetical protein